MIKAQFSFTQPFMGIINFQDDACNLSNSTDRITGQPGIFRSRAVPFWKFFQAIDSTLMGAFV